MSKQTNNQQTNMGLSDAPEASKHENPLPEASAEGDGPVKVEPVDPVEEEEGGESSNSATVESADPVKEEEKEREKSNSAMEVDQAKPKKDSDKSQPFRSCGSQRKRFKWFISQGYEYEDASELAKDGKKYRELRAAAEGRPLEISEREIQLSQQRKSLNRLEKRMYSQLREYGYPEEEALALAPSLVNDPGCREHHLQPDEPKRPGDPVRMVVTMADFPRTVLSEDQAQLLKDAILKLVIEDTATKLKPHFAGCKFIKGYLVFDCRDQQTITWLQHHAQTLNLWDGYDLKVISERLLKSTPLFTVKLADSERETDDEIRNFLNKQNDGIDATKWLFAERKLDAKTLQLTLKIDPFSAKKLHELNYTLNYKFEQVKLTRTTIDLSDPDSPTPSRSSNSSAGNRGRAASAYRGGRPRNSFPNYRRPPNVPMRQNDFNGGGGGGGDYIDQLFNELNRHLFAPQLQQFQNMNYYGGGGAGGSGFPNGRGGRRGGGYFSNNPRQRYF